MNLLLQIWLTGNAVSLVIVLVGCINLLHVRNTWRRFTPIDLPSLTFDEFLEDYCSHPDWYSLSKYFIQYMSHDIRMDRLRDQVQYYRFYSKWYKQHHPKKASIKTKQYQSIKVTGTTKTKQYQSIKVRGMADVYAQCYTMMNIHSCQQPSAKNKTYTCYVSSDDWDITTTLDE